MTIRRATIFVGRTVDIFGVPNPLAQVQRELPCMLFDWRGERIRWEACPVIREPHVMTPTPPSPPNALQFVCLEACLFPPLRKVGYRLSSRLLAS